MTHCDFSARSARDEMRHIIGSSEADVLIGTDKDNNRMQKEGQGSHGILVRTVRSGSGAVPGTRTAVADLCMFGLPACDEGGPGFVNASVRTVSNSRQFGKRMQIVLAQTTQARTWNKQEHGLKTVLQLAPPNGGSTSPTPPPVLEKTFSLTSWLAVEAAAILRRTFCGVERCTLRSTKGEAHSRTTTTRRTFDVHIELTVALLDGVRSL